LVHVPDNVADKVLAGFVVIERLPRATDTISIARPRCLQCLSNNVAKSVLAIHAEGEILVPVLQCRGVMSAEDEMVGLVEGLPALDHLVVVLPAALGGEFERRAVPSELGACLIEALVHRCSPEQGGVVAVGAGEANLYPPHVLRSKPQVLQVQLRRSGLGFD